MYGNSGLKALIKHGNSAAHETASKIKKGNQTLPAIFRFANAVQSGKAGRSVVLPWNEQGPVPSSGSNVRHSSLPYGAPPNVHESATCCGKRDPLPLTNVSYEDLKADAGALVQVVPFIAENNLPFTMTSKVLKLAKELSRDQKVFSELSLDRTSGTYKLKEGVAVACHERLVAEVKERPFSINLDECIAKNKRVLSVLVSYFLVDVGM